MGDLYCRFQPFIFQGVTYFPPSLKPSSFLEPRNGLYEYLPRTEPGQWTEKLKFWERLPLDFSFKINEKKQKNESYSNYQ